MKFFSSEEREQAIKRITIKTVAVIAVALLISAVAGFQWGVVIFCAIIAYPYIKALFWTVPPPFEVRLYNIADQIAGYYKGYDEHLDTSRKNIYGLELPTINIMLIEFFNNFKVFIYHTKRNELIGRYHGELNDILKLINSNKEFFMPIMEHPRGKRKPVEKEEGVGIEAEKEAVAA